MTIRSFLLTSFFISFLSNCEVIDPKEKENTNELIGILALSRSSSSNGSSTSTGRFPTPTCEVSAPSFATLKTAGFETRCGGSCHATGGSEAAKFRVTVYNEVKNYTISGSPTRSTLYNIQSTGSMSGNTDQAVDKAIYCWILGGTNP
ncbi:LIC11213 family lipoprotein [Leptospira ryugenii]|uniref:LIC11213 family lipoprotein n=1 Tax=Leptospira ryugenii TaxID=1917863 RepID=UPI000D5996FB|nr:hypothetical protein [Leptospira ryugenii]